MTPERTHELARRLAEVEDRVAAACRSAGRPRSDVVVVAVTKFFPASDAARLVRLGVRRLGENRDPEAGQKVEQVTDLLDGADLPRWHFVGQLQTNKAARVARYADVVETVDRDRLVRSLATGARRAGRRLDVLLQVGLGGPDAERRGGAAPEDLPRLAGLVAAEETLTLRGLMAVAPRGEDPRPAFDRLAGLAAALRRDHPDATWLSAGMSGDLEDAVAAGATHLRIGSAILGDRPYAG